MKLIKFILTGIILFFSGILQGQVAVNVNIGTPPPWGPSGYSNVRYYYLPDVEAYYDVQSSRFIYYNGVTWVRRTYLPKHYRSYDLYDGYKVVMTDYRGNTPYIHFADYKIKYAKGYHGQPQKNIGMKPGNKNSGGGMHSTGYSGKKQSRGSGMNEGHGKMKKNKGQ